MRMIPSSMAPDAVAEIDARLDEIRRANSVFIPLAIESGSRAWGFPSPDSDYDCRFLFIRPVAAYLSLWPHRDVIETPLEGDLDVNGWDLAKALTLLMKGNVTIIEWLTSPIVYAGDAVFQAQMLALAHEVADRDLVARHYLHLGERQRRAYFADHKSIPHKKIFYALRPAAALRWLRLHPDQAVAPMHFPSLMGEADPPDEVAAITAELIERKAATRELGTAPLPGAITSFIDEEFSIARERFFDGTGTISLVKREKVQAFFLEALRRFSPDAGAQLVDVPD